MSHFTQSTITHQNQSSDAYSLGNQTTTPTQPIDHSTTSKPTSTITLTNSPLTSQITTTVTTPTEVPSNPQNNDQTVFHSTTLPPVLNNVTNELILTSTEEPSLSTNGSTSSSPSYTETTTVSKTEIFLPTSKNYSETLANTLVPDLKNQSITESPTVNTQQSVSSETEPNPTTTSVRQLLFIIY